MIDVSPRSRVRQLGSVTIAAGRQTIPVSGTIDRYGVDDAVMVWLAPRRSPKPTGASSNQPSIDAMMFDPGSNTVDSRASEGIVVVVRDRLIPALALGADAPRALPSSMALCVLHNLAAIWLESDARLNTRQAALAGRAVAELLAAALLPTVPTHVGTRRKSSLLDRAGDVLDRQLSGTVDVGALCRALNCSRSALYRATRPVGGVMALARRRRLAVCHARLSNPGETASLATIASACGFTDPGQFSRSFRRHYGTTPTAVRIAAQRSGRS